MKLNLHNITKRYDKKIAVKNVDLELNNGIYGLLGPNGAGKTTLIHMIVGLTKISEGNIVCNDNEVSFLSDAFIDFIGYLPQYPKFYGNFTAYEFLMYICVLKDIPVKRRKERIKEVLNLVNLAEEKNSKIKTFSGGMRQRLGIAQAIINQPKILFLDEPTAGLDPSERIRFRNIISKLSEDSIIIISTHIVSDVEYMANQIVLIKEGEIVRFKTVQDLKKEVQAFVKEIQIAMPDLEMYLHNYQVTKVTPIEAGYVIRVLDKEDKVNGTIVYPSLEDVYLYHFNGTYI